jgi:hypothetical protein
MARLPRQPAPARAFSQQVVVATWRFIRVDRAYPLGDSRPVIVNPVTYCDPVANSLSGLTVTENRPRLDERISGTTGSSFESRSVYLCARDVQEFPDITFPDSIRRTPRQRRRIEARSEFTAIHRDREARLCRRPSFAAGRKREFSDVTSIKSFRVKTTRRVRLKL